LKRPLSKVSDFGQELRELGARGALFRTSWELRGRIRPFLRANTELQPEFGRYGTADPDLDWPRHLPLADSISVAAAVSLPKPRRDRLAELADCAVSGNILAFGRWSADYGSPPRWNLNPVTGRSWDERGDLSRQIWEASPIGDVKFTWEIGRFPHAYHLARAGAFMPKDAERWAAALLDQMRDFVASNPAPNGAGFEATKSRI